MVYSDHNALKAIVDKGQTEKGGFRTGWIDWESMISSFAIGPPQITPQELSMD